MPQPTEGPPPERPVPLSRYGFTQPAFGVEFRVLLYAPDEPTARSAATAAFDRVAELERKLDANKSGSDIARLVAAGGTAVSVDPATFLVLQKAVAVAQQSGGAFDPTRPPAGGKPGQADWRHVRLDPDPGTVQLVTPGMRLDLTPLARGYAADAVVAVLRGRGVGAALVQAGDTVVVGDAPPGRDGWRVRVPAAGPDAAAAGRDFRVLAHAAVSSRDPAQPDPRAIDRPTNRPAVAAVRVTVIAPNGLTAGPLAEAACALGPVQGQRLIEAFAGTTAVYAAPATHPAASGPALNPNHR